MTTHAVCIKKRLIGAPRLVWLQKVPVSTATQYISSPGVICSAARLSIRRRLLTHMCKIPKTLLIRLNMTEEGRRSIAAAEAMEVFGAATEQPSQAMETSQEAPERKEDAWDGWSSRDKKYQRKGDAGGKGTWSGWSKRKEPEENSSGTGTMDQATQSLIQSRREMGYMLFIDTEPYSCLEQLKLAATKWQDLYAENKVTSPLGLALMLGMVQVLRNKLEALLRDDTLQQRYKNCGWISDGPNAFTPMWHFFEWNPTEKKEFQAKTPPLAHTRVLEILEEMERFLPQPGVLLKFRATKDITQEVQVEVIPFLITIGIRVEGAQKVFDGLRQLSGNGVMKLLGARLRPERGQRQPLAKQVEQAYKSTSYCEWTQRQSRTWK